MVGYPFSDYDTKLLTLGEAKEIILGGANPIK